jgi:uncharacterized protein (DUF1800 family)
MMNLRIFLVAAVFACVAIFPVIRAFAKPVSGSSEADALHVLNRLAYGPCPGDVDRVMRMGVDRYIDEQLHPESIPMSDALTKRLNALSQEELPQAQLITTYRQIIKAAMDDGTGGAPGGGLAIRNALYKKMAIHFGELRLMQATESSRQLEEVMVDFWFNHFNVVAGKGMNHVMMADYEREAIRPYVLGRFRDLLGATAKHPAMLFYLDNWISAAPTADARARVPGTRTAISGLNENYARELMELHTLGVDGGYSQQDVTTLARMLTGWSFDPRVSTGGSTFVFARRLHDYGDKIWLGRPVPVKGEAEGEWALDVLASHPSTAHHIAYELAQYFVADDPPPALVETLAQRYLATGGDIRAVLGTLFASPAFRDPKNFGVKFKTPYQFVVSAVRASGIRVNNVKPLLDTLTSLGMPLYGCQSPDGYKNTEEVWLNPDALAQRINFATALGLGKLPLEEAVNTAVPNDPYAKMEVAQVSTETIAPKASLPSKLNAPIDSDALVSTLGNQISEQTRTRIATAKPPALRAALALGSPDFMRH